MVTGNEDNRFMKLIASAMRRVGLDPDNVRSAEEATVFVLGAFVGGALISHCLFVLAH